MVRIALLGVAIVVLAAGCGGSKSAVYTAAKTQACVATGGGTIGGDLDFVAQTALGGAFIAHLPDDNFVTVAFGEADADAAQLQLAYQQFAFPNVKRNISDVLLRYNNAITLWHLHPSNNDLDVITRCLK